MDEAPTEIHRPRLEAVTFHNGRHHDISAELQVSTPMHDKSYTIRLGNPRFVKTPAEAIRDENALRACFDASCTLLKIFVRVGTIEFWGNDGFHRSINGAALRIACG